LDVARAPDYVTSDPFSIYNERELFAVLLAGGRNLQTIVVERICTSRADVTSQK
jgi:hypothetical protein